MREMIRAIIVGMGRGRSHLRSMRALPDLYEVVGLVDLDQERLAAVLADTGLPTSIGYRSLDAALTHSGANAVMVATWARTHEELVETALRADRHVLVEKPLATTMAAACKLVRLAEGRDRKLVVTQQWRYLPGQRTVRRLLAEGRWGEPQVGHMLSYKARRGEYPESPHSQLWQMTVHEVDSLIAMLGQPVAAVSGHSYRPPATTWKRESTATAELTFASGCHIVLVSTSDARINTLELRVECEHGAVRYRNTASFSGAETIEEISRGSKEWRPVQVDEGPTETALLDQEVAAGFARWINGGPEPETSGRHNLEILGALDALLISSRSGRRQPVEKEC